MYYPPTQASLDALFQSTARLRVVDQQRMSSHPPSAVLADVGMAEVRAVRDMLTIQEGGPAFHCMCMGDLAVELYAPTHPLVALSYHHARSLRHPHWNSDAPLLHGPALLYWLAQRGATGPLLAHQAMVDRAMRDHQARQIWLAAAPPVLAANLPRYETDPSGFPAGDAPPTMDEAERLVRATYPSVEAAVATLLEWYGTGSGPWSGYPSYEDVPSILVRRLGLPVARSVLARPHVTERALLGGARLFSSWEVVTKKPFEVCQVPPAVWARMSPIVLRIGDQDVTARFQHAASLAAESQRLAARRPPAPVDAPLPVIGVCQGGDLKGGLVTDGQSLYASSGGAILVFDGKSQAPSFLYEGADPSIELASVKSKMLMLSHASSGTISKIITDGSPLIVMSSQQTGAGSPVCEFGVLAWIAQPHVSGHARSVDDPPSAIVSHDFPQVRILRIAPRGAFSLVLDEEHLYWCEMAGPTAEIWRVSHVQQAEPARFASAGEPWPHLPKLQLSSSHVFWLDAGEKALCAVDKAGAEAPVRVCSTNGVPQTFAVDDHDAFLLTRDSESAPPIIEHVSVRGGTLRKVATLEGSSRARPSLLLTRHALYIAFGDRIVCLRRE